jgi:hypothetical protein
MCPEQSFDVLAQRLIGATGIVQIRGALAGVFPIQRRFKNDSLVHGFPA